MKFFHFFLLFFLMHGANAEWIKLPNSDVGNNYIEVPLLKIDENNQHVQTWLLQDFYFPQNGSKSMKSINEFDCAKTTVRVLRLIVFTESMANGSILADFESTNEQKIWRSIPQDSFANSAFDIACRKK